MYPTQFLSVAQVDNSKPPAPKFNSVVPDGEDVDYIFNQNETVKLQYTADRFEVEGLVILANGSDLSWEFNFTNPQNFTKTSSLGPTSVYEYEFNVTSYTIFIVYSWYNDISNRTMEELENVDGALGHQLWITEGSQYPNFNDVQGGTPQDENIEIEENTEFYVPMYKNVTIVYTTQDPAAVNSTYVILTFANSEEDLYNETLSVRVSMNQTIFSEEGVSTFEYTYNVTQRLVYFTAFNDFGWERKRHNQPIFHKITTGFDFSFELFESENEFTDLDPIVFNVTASNSTSDDMFSYRYRYFENNTSENPLVDWTEKPLDEFFVEQKYLNVSIDDVNHTQNVTIYNVYFELDLNVSNVLELQVFVDYLGHSENSSIPKIITIQDSKPEVSLTTPDIKITNADNGFIGWEYSSLRGTVSEALISSNTTIATLSNLSVLGDDNQTFSFDDGAGVIEGYHEITLNVTNSFEIVNISDPLGPRITVFASRIITAIYRVDTTIPTVSFINNPLQSEPDGRVKVEFDFDDLGIYPTGVVYATLSWGNGLIINATSLTEASIVYRKSGTYTITLNVTDAAGNSNVDSFEIEVTVPTIETSDRKRGPISAISIFAAFITIVMVIKSRKNKY